jgi:predicted GNAT superfamily acetyltransferase
MAKAIATCDAAGNLSIDWQMNGRWHNVTCNVLNDGPREAPIAYAAFMALRWIGKAEIADDKDLLMAAVMRVAVAEMDKVLA